MILTIPNAIPSRGIAQENLQEQSYDMNATAVNDDSPGNSRSSFRSMTDSSTFYHYGGLPLGFLGPGQ